MKRLVAVFLLLSVVEGRHSWRHSWPPSGHPHHFHPDQTLEPQVCPPGHVQTCSPPGQSQFPSVQPPPPGSEPGNQPFPNWNQPSPNWNQPSPNWNQPSPNWNQPSPNWNQQPQFQQNGNTNSEFGKTEWVCQSPTTGDTMVIVAVNGPPSQTGQNPHQVPNINGNDHRGNPNDGNLNNGGYTTPQSTTSANERSFPNGGEGLIDVRSGA